MFAELYKKFSIYRGLKYAKYAAENTHPCRRDYSLKMYKELQRESKGSTKTVEEIKDLIDRVSPASSLTYIMNNFVAAIKN